MGLGLISACIPGPRSLIPVSEAMLEKFSSDSSHG